MKKIIQLFLLLTFPLAAENSWSLLDLNSAAKTADSGVVWESFGEKSPWTVRINLHGKHPQKEEMLKHCSASRNGETILIKIAPEVTAYKTRSGVSQMVTGAISRKYELPADAAGKILTARLEYKLKGNSRGMIIFQKNRKNLKVCKGLSAVVPADADTAIIIYRLEGPGELAVQKAGIILEETKTESDAICYAMGYLDRKFYLPGKKSFPIYFMLKRPYPKRARNVKMELELPNGVEAAVGDNGIRQESAGCFDITTSFNSTITSGGNFCCWRPMMLMLKANRKLDGEILRYRLIVDQQAGKSHPLQLFTLPEVTAAVPNNFLTGIFMQSNGNLSAAAAKNYMELIHQSGFNILRVSPSPELRKEMQRNQIIHCNAAWSIRDGYPRVKNNTTPFLDIEGKTVQQQLCPVEVYTRGENYRKHILPMIRETMRNSTFHLMNWEVYSSNYKGCFCSRCKQEFVRHTGISEEEVGKVWPRQVINRYHDIWVKFRSWQHGQICKVLEEDMAAVRPGCHFMPMLSVVCFNEKSNFAAQYHPSDFLKYLKWINVWGPYLHSIGMNQPYEYIPGRYLRHYYGVKQVVNYIARHGGEKVKITGLPYGSHGTRANPPEAVALETLNNFILGYKGSLVYWFHFDYRYWSLMAQANAKISACENMVNVWPETKQFQIKPASPTLQPKHWRPYLGVCDVYPELPAAESSLIAHAWNRNKSLLAAVGNFWEKSAVHFTLSIPGKTGNYVIYTPYPPHRYRKVTGEELAKGVLLRLNPLSWEFFLVEPWQEGRNYGTPFRKESELAMEKAEIQKAWEEENRILAEFEKMFSISDYSFGETPEFTAGSVKLSEKKLKGAQALSIETPAYQALLEPARGAQVTSLIVNRQQAVFQNDSGSFGKIGFWKPNSKLVMDRFRIRQIKEEKDHVTVILDRPQTLGFDLELTWKFYQDRIEELLTVRNAGTKAVNTVPRFHHMLQHLANQGKVKFNIGKETFEPVVKDRLLICRTGILGKANIQGGETVFSSSNLRFKLKMVPLTPVQGYYLWNNPGAAVGSFEPIFEGKMLQPGEKLSIGQSWSIQF